MKNGKPTILINVESTEGYGHFNIVSMINDELQKMGADVHIMSSTLYHAADHFSFPGATIHHLPSVYFKEKDGKREHFTLGNNLLKKDEAYKNEMRTAAREVMEQVQPDAVMFEFYPFMMKWRDPFMKAVKDEYGIRDEPDSKRPEIIGLCRDLMFSENTLTTLGRIHHHFDKILVRGDERFATLADSNPEWNRITKPVEYMGQFVQELPATRDTPEADRAVIAFAGGGYYPEDQAFFETIIAARAHSEQFQRQPWQLYVSDNMPEEQFQALKTLAASQPDGEHIRILRPIDPDRFRQEIVDSAAAFCRGGYNTTSELMQAHRPFVLLPRETPEQLKRAEIIYRMAGAEPLNEQEKTDPALLAKTLDASPHTTGAALADLDWEGAKHTAARIMELAMKHKALPQAQELPKTQLEALSARHVTSPSPSFALTH